MPTCQMRSFRLPSAPRFSVNKQRRNHYLEIKGYCGTLKVANLPPHLIKRSVLQLGQELWRKEVWHLGCLRRVPSTHDAQNPAQNEFKVDMRALTSGDINFAGVISSWITGDQSNSHIAIMGSQLCGGHGRQPNYMFFIKQFFGTAGKVLGIVNIPSPPSATSYYAFKTRRPLRLGCASHLCNLHSTITI